MFCLFLHCPLRTPRIQLGSSAVGGPSCCHLVCETSTSRTVHRSVSLQTLVFLDTQTFYPPLLHPPRPIIYQDQQPVDQIDTIMDCPGISSWKGTNNKRDDSNNNNNNSSGIVTLLGKQPNDKTLRLLRRCWTPNVPPLTSMSIRKPLQLFHARGCSKRSRYRRRNTYCQTGTGEGRLSSFVLVIVKNCVSLIVEK